VCKLAETSRVNKPTRIAVPPRRVRQTGTSVVIPGGEGVWSGVFAWLGRAEGEREKWRNPIESGRVGVTSSSAWSSLVVGPSLVGDGSGDLQQYKGCFWTSSATGQWVCFDLDARAKGVRLFPTEYVWVFNYSNWWPTTWRFEGSTDKQNWTLLDAKTNDQSFSTAGSPPVAPRFKCDVELKEEVPFRYFRIVVDGFLGISGLELFGTVSYEIASSPN